MNINSFEIWLTNFLMSLGILGYLLSCFLIVIESIIPVLPLSVFITILFYKYGYIIGFISSYICTILGCIISYSIFNGKLNIKFQKYISDKDKLNKVTNNIKNIKFTSLCLLISLPFTPQFLVNIGAGLVNMSKKKYLLGLLVGKIFLIIFWGFIGTSLINSIKSPINLIYIALLLLGCFILSKLVSRKEGIE